MTIVNVLVEGPMDETVADRLLDFTGLSKGICFPKRGWTYIKENIRRYNEAAHAAPCLVLIDLMDTKLPCPGEVLDQWLPSRHPSLLLRVVVREIESWLLADHRNLAAFLGVSAERVPGNPEQLTDPKAEVLRLARRSRSKQIREALIPPPGSTAQIGPLYAAEMIRFVLHHWDIEFARQSAPSLDRCLLRLQGIARNT